MLTKMLPDQISSFWNVIRYAIERSLPPTVGESPDKMSRILSSALCGKVDVWASYSVGEERKFEGLVLTKIIYDDTSGTRNLLIYCLFGYSKISQESWKSGFATLLKYAKSKGCSRIVGYTDVGRIVDIVKMLGGEAKYTFISFDVDKQLSAIGG